MRALLVAVLSTFSLIASAQALDDDFDARMVEADAYVRGPAMKDMLDQMMSPNGMIAQMATIMPELSDQSPAVRESAMNIALEEFRKLRPDMEQALIEASAKTFTLAELKAANAFYATPEGRGMASKTNLMMQNYLPLYTPIMERYMTQLQARIKELEGGQ